MTRLQFTTFFSSGTLLNYNGQRVFSTIGTILDFLIAFRILFPLVKEINLSLSRHYIPQLFPSTITSGSKNASPKELHTPLRNCSQISGHHFCLTTPLQTCQTCYSDNSSANSSLCRASILNLGSPCPLWVSAPISISLSPMNFFKSLSPLFYGLLALESRTITLLSISYSCR